MPKAAAARTSSSWASRTVAAPYLQVEIYRPGSETRDFAEPRPRSPTAPPRSARSNCGVRDEPLDSKFGPLSIVAFETANGAPRHCLGFVRAYDDPRLQLSGWFCQGGDNSIERSTLACALDRLTLLSAGSEPKVGALFAQAELNRSFCGQRDPAAGADAEVPALWKALERAAMPRRIGRAASSD